VKLVFLLAIVAAGAACGVHGASDGASGAPPPTVVEHEGDGARLRVERAERFVLATATRVLSTPELTVTGVVSPDVSRAVPVLSLASGRVVELRARLGDRVQKGQLLLRIHSADVASAVADYRKAQADGVFAQAQLERTRDLFDRGALAKKDLEVAQDGAAKAAVDVQNTAERLRVLGIDANESAGGVIDIVAPVSGVITEQNVTPAAGVKTLDNSPNLFTISDVSQVWIVCDVPERDLPNVRVGDAADIRVAAYPDRPLRGRIDNISPLLDPNLRTGKVRIEVANPGILRIGMFVTATLHGQAAETHAAVPASAILHLHDRDWVYVASGEDGFQRRAIVGGPMRPGRMQEVISGLEPGERVVANALVFQNVVEQ
jgi:cobalt-zinc-cadmium efflux system membrane fusion protein